MVAPTQENKNTEYSPQNALNTLAIMLKIIYEDNQDVFLKKPEEVSVDLLKNLSDSFILLSTLFEEVIAEWFGSNSEGFDVFEKSEELGDRLDVKVSEADKLDFEQIRKIMNRMNRLDDALDSLEKISFYLKYYEDLCKQKGLTTYANLSEIFRVYGVEEFTKILRNEIKKRKSQVERNNMYNQAKLNTKTLKIAYAAFFVSVLFAILTSLDLLLKYF
jgi:hypothetical protein